MSKPMTAAQILTALKAEGLTVKEYPGWKTRCRCCPDTGPHKPGGPFIRAWGDVKGCVQHITGGALGGRSVEGYIRDIILGDKNLPCKVQFVTDPDGVVWLVAIGRCNHAGEVGSKVKAHMEAADFSTTDSYDDRFRGTGADGNAITYGNECIAASAMNAKQRASSVLLWAAIARFHKWTGQEVVGHGEVSQARVSADPNLNMGAFRKDIMARVKAGTKAPAPKPPADPKPTPPKTTIVTAMLLPMAGYNADDAKGVTHWKANTDGLADLVNHHHPDIVGTTELSDRAVDKMRPRFDAGVAGYARGHDKETGGTDGRYIYRRKATTDYVASGHVSAAKDTLLNGDTKEGAWAVVDVGGTRIGAIAAHTENEDGVDKKSHKNADDLRVAQMFSIVEQGLAKIKAHDVDEDHVIVMADTNSSAMVKAAMVKAGWTAVGPGYFTGWSHTGRATFDWVFIKGGAAGFTRITHQFSDHTALLIEWHIIPTD